MSPESSPTASPARRRPEGRTAHQIRPLSFEVGFTRYAEGSVLVRSGNTHVLCTVSIDEKVPEWMAGKGKGWVTAEYSMLPRSTHTRSRRERDKVSGRTHEIQRLIGRALRTIVDVEALGERQLLVDCDVLQADGGTRTASITGACVAVGIALHKLQSEGRIKRPALVDTVSAVSLGLKKSEVLVDLDYEEDSTCDVDMNFVMTGRGGLVEVQGTAERKPFSRTELDALLDRADAALRTIRDEQRKTLAAFGVELPD